MIRPAASPLHTRLRRPANAEYAIIGVPLLAIREGLRHAPAAQSISFCFYDDSWHYATAEAALLPLPPFLFQFCRMRCCLVMPLHLRRYWHGQADLLG